MSRYCEFNFGSPAVSYYYYYYYLKTTSGPVGEVCAGFTLRARSVREKIRPHAQEIERKKMYIYC